MDTEMRPIYMLSTRNPLQKKEKETHFRPQDTYSLKVRGWKNIFHVNGKQKFDKVKQMQKIATGAAILISDRIDLKIKKIIRDKKGHYLMIKGSIQEEEHNNCKYPCT